MGDVPEPPACGRSQLSALRARSHTSLENKQLLYFKRKKTMLHMISFLLVSGSYLSFLHAAARS
ncbi:MAG: hypothetical protein AAGU74_13525, partial [Bacillota bacterium]